MEEVVDIRIGVDRHLVCFVVADSESISSRGQRFELIFQEFLDLGLVGCPGQQLVGRSLLVARYFDRFQALEGVP